MIGVLAVIAILASMLIPKIFEAINSARINNTVQSYNSIKTAVLDHYGKFGALNYNGSTQAPATALELAAYDTGILLPETMIDKPFRARVGISWQIAAVAGVAAATLPNADPAAFNLDGTGVANDAAPATLVVEAVITGVAMADALEISERLDGVNVAAAAVNLSNPPASLAADPNGRVKYGAPAADGTTTVYIYICHR